MNVVKQERTAAMESEEKLFKINPSQFLFVFQHFPLYNGEEKCYIKIRMAF